MKSLLKFALLLPLCTSSLVQVKTVHVPMQFRTVSGIRPFLPVKLNGKPFLFMLHANAGFYAMTNHANAASADIKIPPATSSYGIERSGKVSALGRSTSTLERLDVAGLDFAGVPLEIFETPQNPPMNGMLGIGWMKAAHCFVDYDRLAVGLRSACRKRTSTPGSSDLRSKLADIALIR